MWTQFWTPDVSWLPLFDALKKKEDREKRNLQNEKDRDNVEIWLNWDSEVNNKTSQILQSESSEWITQDIDFGWKLLISQYIENNQDFWSVKVLNVKHHGFYNIAVIEISHQFLPKKYIAKWNKYNPVSWKYNWEPVSYPKTSPWRVVKKTYRIQYTPWKEWEGNYWIYCYWGKIKDWKRVELNESMIIPILKEIESLAES